jgi:transcriptional regulator with XRE-family HTH domain
MIGNYVGKYRKEKGASLEQVARAVGSEKSYISKIASGKRCPKAELMFKLAEYFKCKIEDLFYKKDE